MDLSTPFAAVQLASLDEADIARSERLLLVAGARIANTGMRWIDERRQSLGIHWGQAPIRLEPVTGTLTLQDLQDAKSVALQPLDSAGQPQGTALPFSRAGDAFTIELTGVPATPWYLVEIER